MDLSRWFHVRFDEQHVFCQAEPPGAKPWSDQFAWGDVVRVCFEVTDFLQPDNLYVFVRQRPESYVIPMEAEGGPTLLDELIRRKLFDAELAIKAASAVEGLYCWPEPESEA